MSFRLKLALVFTMTIVVAVALVAWGVSTYTQREFEKIDQRHTNALTDQFKQEYSQRGDEVVHRVTAIKESNATMAMAIELTRPNGDVSKFVFDADGLAKSYLLDFLDIVGDDGSVISSKEWQAHFGYKTDWVTTGSHDWNQEGAFLNRMELPDGVALSLTAVRVVSVNEKNLYIIGGVQLDKDFLKTLALPEGMRALLYKNLQAGFDPTMLTDKNGSVAQAEKLSPLIERVQKQTAAAELTVEWNSADPASAENFHAIPLQGRGNQLLGVLLVGSSRAELVTLVGFIRQLAVIVGGAGILLGVFMSVWFSARVTRPLAKLATGAREVAAGDWAVRVDVKSRDEVGQLARDFNEMTRQLAEQRERLVQAERVAAWREIARRLAHELKNPLFPLQLTLENLQRARQQTPALFDEIFTESTKTLRAELDNLKTIVTRFSDFSKMPAPQFQPTNLNDAVRNAVRVYDAQFNVLGRPPVTPELYLDESMPVIQADPDLLHRALSNLVLNSLDAMPSGGTLTVRTGHGDGVVGVEISDTGAGLTPEECERLFTPYYTTKRTGTGLGLAIVQSIVSDHFGKISVESTPGHGAMFRIELPVRPPGAESHLDVGRSSDRGAGGVSGNGFAPHDEAELVKEKRRTENVGVKSTLGLGE
jgi:two-component system, NtrC family, nitrogen regulation sensor histidine kinase NtrY